MATHPTSLKLPGTLKERIDNLARQGGESAHSLMVRALESAVESMERRAAFLREAGEADREMEQSGIGYAHRDVASWLRAKAAGRNPKRPKPASWRR